MASRNPLTVAEQQFIQERKQAGDSLHQIAADLQCSVETVRKWWRRLRTGVIARRRGRPAHGILSTYPPALVADAIRLKQQHPHWGPANVNVELHHMPAWRMARLPSDARLAALFKRWCPEAVQPRHHHTYPERPPTAVRDPHQRWQIDGKEHVVVGDQEIVTIVNVRDVASAVMLASQAIVTTTPQGWRKVTLTEVQDTLRTAFTVWGLPLEIQTDHEVVYTGAPKADFPSRFTLWLCGLGIRHVTSRVHRPTDQPHIERNHRTLGEMTWVDTPFADVTTLQQVADERRARYNEELPVHARACAGRPPLVAYPTARASGRPYQRGSEWIVFQMTQVDAYLACQVWVRQATATGMVSLGHQPYGLGRAAAHQTVAVRFFPATRTFRFSREDGTVLAERPAVGLDAADLIGFTPDAVDTPMNWQIPLPLEGV